jgi:hypothetical protein
MMLTHKSSRPLWQDGKREFSEEGSWETGGFKPWNSSFFRLKSILPVGHCGFKDLQIPENGKY